MYEGENKSGIWKWLAITFFAFSTGFLTNEYLLEFGDEKDFRAEQLEENFENQTKNDDTELDIDLSLFWKVWSFLESKFVDNTKLDYQNMVYGAIKGMVNSLEDPYTVYMDPDESKEFLTNLQGELVGIGAELSAKDGNLVVVSPLRNSPAEKAGLLPGDIIYEINGQNASEMTLFEAVMMIRGELGTTVKLSILRKDLDEPLEISIVRENIEIESVTLEKLEDNLIYVAVNQFNENTEEEFSKAVSEIILSQPNGLILDLRFNSGGFLDISVDMLSHLLESNKVAVRIRQRGEEEEVIKTIGKAKVLAVPIVVLVNQGSASASEIVAGAIQDHKRGILMGEKTFGKGSVQEVKNFEDGSSIRLTIAKWLTPNSREISGVGIVPDITVELDKEVVKAGGDNQKDEAIEYLKGLK